MPADLNDRAAQAVELAQRSGADEAWATASQGRDVEFGYRAGALEKVKDTTSRSLAVQIYANGRYSSHTTTDLNPGRLQSFVAEAVAITRALEPDEHRRITPAELFAGRRETELDLVDANVAAIDRAQRLEWCRALDAGTSGHERVISATAGIYDGSQRTASASSNGFSGVHESTYCWYGSSVTMMDRDDRRAEDGYFVGGVHVNSLPAAEEVATTALERTRARLGAEKGPTVKTAMLVDSQAAASLIGRLLRPASARAVHQGRSFWSGLAGEQALGEKLTIVDDPLIPRAMGSRHFDREGIAAASLPLVEAGVIRNLYVDTYHGRKTGMPPTTGTPSNRVIQTGDHTLADLLGAVDNGVYVTSWLGGNADSTTGDFSLGLRGHLIENGEIGRPVGEMNVTGNLRELFNRLEIVGNDVYPYSTTLSPSLVFSDVDFSGA